MRVYLEFLGCRLNEAELSNWKRQFLNYSSTKTDMPHDTSVQNPVQIVQHPEDADVITLNTCAVTGEASKKSRRRIRYLQKANPQAKTVVTGCYATLEPQKLSRDLEVDLIVPNKDKDLLPKKIIERWGDLSMPYSATLPEAQPALAHSRTRAFIKVQDGCRNRCSFCIVTKARGEEISRPVHEIIEEINYLHDLGYQEVVLTGVHLGGYGSDINTSLFQLITTVLSNTSVPRVRLGSLEPWDLEENFFTLWENKRLCTHLHLPLQSGSDSVLKRMIRRCTIKNYKQLVHQAKEISPLFHISTDLIIGFPGESEQEFCETMETIQDIPFGDMHLFTYSPREGTAAMRLPNHVSKTIKRERHQKIKDIAQKKYEDFTRLFDDQIQNVLWERDADLISTTSSNPNATSDTTLYLWKGYTNSYIRVQTQSSRILFNQVTPTKLQWGKDGLDGSISI